MHFNLLFRSVIRLLHLVWCWRGPSWMVRNHKSIPRKILYNPHSYHDVPTIIFTVISWASQRAIFSRRITHFSKSSSTTFPLYVALSASSGILFHALSILLLSHRAPQYNLAQLDIKNTVWTALTASAEEYLWGNIDKDSIEFFSTILGFSLIHYPLSGIESSNHMIIFSLIARSIEDKQGWLHSSIFHTFYNMAVASSV